MGADGSWITELPYTVDTIHGYGQEYLGAVLTDVGVEQSVDVVI